MNKILVFAGTKEGREFAGLCVGQAKEIHVCVATEYGEEIIKDNTGFTVHQGRMNLDEMKEFIISNKFDVIVDATHPYAVEVSANIKAACEACDLDYNRLLRSNLETQADFVYVDSKEDAINYLNKNTGNILFTTGSKDLPDYIAGINDIKRIYARILTDADSVAKCKEMGLTNQQIICMQGPFSAELNTAMLKQLDAKFLLTKETGVTGGFPEKIAGAQAANATAVVIKRPEESGSSLEELCQKLGLAIANEPCCQKVPDTDKKNVYLLGIGMGHVDSLTVEGYKACEKSDVIIGAKRIIQGLESFGKPMIDMYKPEDVKSYLNNHLEAKEVIVAFSGDVGFYSGATKMRECMEEAGYSVHTIPGISSVVFFASRLGMPWQDVKLVSLHGRKQNIIHAIKHNKMVFSLIGKAESVRDLANQLLEFGFGDIRMHLGFQLSYPEEIVRSGKPADFTDFDEDGLSVVILENEAAEETIVTHGLVDTTFTRGDAPMTKEEIRSISLSKLCLTAGGVLYDVGAGTGSIGIECALQMPEGEVYAIERKDEAVELMEKNRILLGAENLHVVKGLAPEALVDLPAPTHAFIGGSSGNMKEILQLLLEKNPKVRIVVNAIAMETIAEVTLLLKEFNFEYVDICQVAVGKSRKLGRYNMVFGQNPVTIFTLQN